MSGFNLNTDWQRARRQQPLCPADWFVSGLHVGEGKIVLRDINMAPESYHFFCPHCGDVWARILTRPQFRHTCINQECPQHGFGYLGTAGEDVMTHAPYGALLHMVKMCLRDPDQAPIYVDAWKRYGLRPAIGG